MNMEAVGNKVVILKDEKPEVSGNGTIYIPEEAREKVYSGEVLSVGCFVKHIEPGDHAYYPRHAGTDIEADGVEYVIMAEEMIMAVIKREPQEVAGI